jgi:hypothetical protein
MYPHHSKGFKPRSLLLTRYSASLLQSRQYKMYRDYATIYAMLEGKPRFVDPFHLLLLI